MRYRAQLAYPYLLPHLTITRLDHVSAMDIAVVAAVRTSNTR